MVKSREAIFWIFIGPPIMATFFGILFKPQPPAKVQLDIVNRDATDSVAKSITESLEQDGVVVTGVTAASQARMTLVVPPGAAAAIAAGQPLDLRLHTVADETRAEGNLRFRILKALVASAIGVKPTDTPGPLRIVTTDAGSPRTGWSWATLTFVSWNQLDGWLRRVEACDRCPNQSPVWTKSRLPRD